MGKLAGTRSALTGDFAIPGYRCPLGWRPASRLLPPRSGLERSDFVPWPNSELRTCPLSRRFREQSGCQKR
jgi:hypothetical protein